MGFYDSEVGLSQIASCLPHQICLLQVGILSRGLHQPQAAASGLVPRHQRRLVNVLAQRLPADMLSSYSHGLQSNTVRFNNDKASLLRDVTWNFWHIGCDQWRSQKYFLRGATGGDHCSLGGGNKQEHEMSIDSFVFFYIIILIVTVVCIY